MTAWASGIVLSASPSTHGLLQWLAAFVIPTPWMDHGAFCLGSLAKVGGMHGSSFGATLVQSSFPTAAGQGPTLRLVPVNASFR